MKKAMIRWDFESSYIFGCRQTYVVLKKVAEGATGFELLCFVESFEEVLKALVEGAGGIADDFEER